MILGGAMFKFENLNPAIGGGNKVPLISKFMVSKWAYEAIMIAQFQENAYEQKLYDYEQLISDYNYRTSYLYPYLEDVLNNQDGGDNSRCSDTVQQTLQFEYSRALFPSAQRKKLPRLTIEGAFDAINELKEYYQTRQNELSRKKDDFLIKLNKSIGENGVMLLKRHSNNEDVAEIVQNTTTKNRYYVYNNRVFQNYDFIYMRDHLDPLYKPQGDIMFVPNKLVLGQLIPTFWYNVVMIWMFIFVTFYLLYFDVIKRLTEINLFKK